jgi:hypothetical protein
MYTWSKRGELTPKDIDVIGAIARQSEPAARIFITGEINGGRVSEEDERLLFASNNALVDLGGDPLFELTRDVTIRMCRFNPPAVRDALPKGLVDALVARESERYGFEGLPFGEAGFHYELIKALRARYGDLKVRVTQRRGFEAFYQSMYFAALYLFGKPGYMGVPVSRHFALEETDNFFDDAGAGFRPLTREETDVLRVIRERAGHTRLLTNREIDYLAGLFPQLDWIDGSGPPPRPLTRLK